MCAATDSLITASKFRSVRPPLRPRAWRKLEDLVDRALFLGQEVEQGGRHKRIGVDAQLRAHCRHQSFKLRSEENAAATRHDIHRLDAEGVPHQGEPGSALIVEGEREHAAEPGEGICAPLPPSLQDNLCV
jgi:hypothetical protein